MSVRQVSTDIAFFSTVSTAHQTRCQYCAAYPITVAHPNCCVRTAHRLPYGISVPRHRIPHTQHTPRQYRTAHSRIATRCIRL
eukprot:1371779-Rhodomonas_salina.4